ncbi:SDR family NAD(P)-dependent oxidoreductase [Sediminicola luteus]|uniref:Short-chain dehydrogenase n=1 Tax=Sediminicola luteus TaxID=319238 RepID=A0A2A4GA53_9FLAO|nr:SDR family NAD(P)-dependent oxidoreductase [Sediminicola luteus]PCE65829.1 hypothetical protein B7P33_00550 [Sediminicola luteus]
MAVNSQRWLITGGASGLGKELAEQLLSQPHTSVLLLDMDQAGLAVLASSLSDTYGTERVATYVQDIRDTRKLQETIHAISAKGPIDVLVNNAGLVGGKLLVDLDHSQIDDVLDVNVKALVHISKMVLQLMYAQGHGHIVNIASAAGFTPVPYMAPYVGSKWAVVGFSESLRLEMEALGPDFHCTTVCPAYIDTGMFEGAKDNFLLPMLHAEQVVKSIIKAVRKKKIYVRLPFMVRFTPFLRGVLPTRVFDTIIGKWLGIYKSMAAFKGRGA